MPRAGIQPRNGPIKAPLALVANDAVGQRIAPGSQT